MSVVIAPMQAEHVTSVAALEHACFSRPWSAEALTEELHNPTARFLVALDSETVVGYIGMHVLFGEASITNVAVSPARRREGIAATLLRAAAEGVKRITLEVRASNAAAIALYEREGFSRDGIRPRFYDRPVEDAVLYSLNLKG